MQSLIWSIKRYVKILYYPYQSETNKKSTTRSLDYKNIITWHFKINFKYIGIVNASSSSSTFANMGGLPKNWGFAGHVY